MAGQNSKSALSRYLPSFLHYDKSQHKKKSTGRKHLLTSIGENFGGLNSATHGGPDLNPHHRRSSALSENNHIPQQNDEEDLGDDEGLNDDDDDDSQVRTIYTNMPLPSEFLDHHGHPNQNFARNKIHTAKYTPLTFIPLNLFHQFHHVANVYFLIMVILQSFAIFGAVNPGLPAIPLIVIVVATGIRDAIEDFGRTLLDNKVNNRQVSVLKNWINRNASNEKVSLWRRIKKFFSHSIQNLYGKYKTKLRKSRPEFVEEVEEQPYVMRKSLDSVIASRHSLGSNHRTSDIAKQDLFNSNNIEMTRQSTSGRNRRSIDTRRSAEYRHSVQLNKKKAWQSPEVKAFINHRLSLESAFTAGLDRSSKKQQRFAGSLENQASSDKAVLDEKEYMMEEFTQRSVINKRKLEILHMMSPEDEPKFKSEYWKNVKVGDILQLRADEEIPADVVILSTSDPEGICFVETKNLDGETNLKMRNALQATRSIRDECGCAASTFFIESEGPHADLYHYTGVLKYNPDLFEENFDSPEEHEDTEYDSEPIDISNLLLRGSTLRNTDWVIGIVVFTGADSKIMMNSGITPSKRSRIARELNLSILVNFALLIIMCVVSAIVASIKGSNFKESLYFFEDGLIGGNYHSYGVIVFFVAAILFQNLVPISLYITIEIVKTFQAFFIHSDVNMYYEKLNYPCTPKSWNISDDLGQIEYIFSDKTGTLTQNLMEFRKCSVNGIAYGEAYTEAQIGMDKRHGLDVSKRIEEEGSRINEDRRKMVEMLLENKDKYFLQDEMTFVSSKFVADLKTGASGKDQQDAANYFIFALALCHSVVTEFDKNNKLIYKAQSPDEAALVETARHLGCTLLKRTQNEMVLSIKGRKNRYQLLDVIEFNSDRKRMSVICRIEGKIVLFCKGADNVIAERLAPGQEKIIQQTYDHINEFSSEGLRTLCIACREVPLDEYREWKSKLKEAFHDLEDRDRKILEVASHLEQDLKLLGCTAIEDRLQDEVPHTISLLLDAGIKLWVLTGDKVETAINIGYSCNLLGSDMKLLMFADMSTDTTKISKLLDDYLLSEFGIIHNPETFKIARKNHHPPPGTHALIIDGSSLATMLDPEVKEKFLLLCKNCKSVICCRVSPAQKAMVTEMVKYGLGVMTLAVGDGANDVAMIQAADVGIGIAGEEGRQAVMSSDYAIGQFKYLQRLLLVHGRWDYRRIAELISCFFYKNIVWTLCLFWWQIYTNFDGYFLFDYTYIMLFNLFFTSLPVGFLGALDQDVDAETSLKYPQLYARGILRLEWNNHKFWLYMFDGVVQSAISFFLSYLLIHRGDPVTLNGKDSAGINEFGIFVALPVIITSNLYVLMVQYSWDILSLLVWLASLALFFIWNGAYSQFLNNQSQWLYKIMPRTFGDLSIWANCLLIVVACLFPRFLITSYRRIRHPSDVEIVQELTRKQKVHKNALDSEKMNGIEKGEITDARADNGNLSNFTQEDQDSFESDVATPHKYKPIYQSPFTEKTKDSNAHDDGTQEVRTNDLDQSRISAQDLPLFQHNKI